MIFGAVLDCHHWSEWGMMLNFPFLLLFQQCQLSTEYRYQVSMYAQNSAKHF